LKFKDTVVSLQNNAKLRWKHTGKISTWYLLRDNRDNSTGGFSACAADSYQSLFIHNCIND